MIEKTVITYLNAQLDVPVYMEKPEVKPEKYVVISVLDFGRTDHIDAVTLDLTAYAPSLLDAAELCSLVREKMFGIITLANVSSSKLGGGGQAIQTATKEYAYDCIFNLFYKEA